MNQGLGWLGWLAGCLSVCLGGGGGGLSREPSSLLESRKSVAFATQTEMNVTLSDLRLVMVSLETLRTLSRISPGKA